MVRCVFGRDRSGCHAEGGLGPILVAGRAVDPTGLSTGTHLLDPVPPTLSVLWSLAIVLDYQVRASRPF